MECDKLTIFNGSTNIKYLTYIIIPSIYMYICIYNAYIIIIVIVGREQMRALASLVSDEHIHVSQYYYITVQNQTQSLDEGWQKNIKFQDRYGSIVIMCYIYIPLTHFGILFATLRSII